MLINIGLARADGKPDLAPTAVTAALRRHHVPVRDAAVHTSDTERTLVVRTPDDAATMAVVYAQMPRVAEQLEQEAIAIYSPVLAAGRLVGPQADRWGPFDATRFLLLDGSTLAQGDA